MKFMSRILLLLSIAILMTGCKLAVIVVEGGEVSSSGWRGTCVAGNICSVVVDDPNFSEIFTAVPDPGWQFVKWNKGGRMFCGDSTEPTCTLSLEGTSGIEGIEKILASDNTFYLMPIFSRLEPDSIMVDGREWAQVDLFTNLTWEEINAVCPEGVCAGILKGFDLTGWTWASVDDANALFNYYIGSQELGPGPDSYTEGKFDSEWATDFYNDGMRATCGSQQWGYRITSGHVSEYSFTAGLIDFLTDDGGEIHEDGIGDAIGTYDGGGVEDDPEDCTGGWFYR